MELRKVQEVGGGTLLVSLPKVWASRHSLRKGSVVTLSPNPDGSLILYPAGKERTPREVIIKYPPKYPEQLVNEITASYLFGYDIIRVAGSERLSYEYREMVKGTVQKLAGLEIVEEDANSMTAQFLPEPSSLNPEKLFRRMHMLVLGMHKDVITSILEGDTFLLKVVMERDDEVDRLYFLIVRLIRSAVLDARLAKSFDLSLIECLDYRIAANILEDIADISVEIARASERVVENPSDGSWISSLSEVASLIQESQELSVKAFLTKNAENARDVVKYHAKVLKVLGQLKRDVLNSPNLFIEQLAVLEGMERITRLMPDVADLGFPLYPMVG